MVNLRSFMESRRVDDPTDPLFNEYFALLKKKSKDLVTNNEVVMFEGRDGPVLRWASGNTMGKRAGALAPGTHLQLNLGHGSIGTVQQKGNYKRTNAYKALMEYLIPATDDPEVYGGLSWLLHEGFKQVEGGDVYVDAVCPTDGTRFKVRAYKKGDSKALQTILEQVLERPAQRQEINVQGGLFHQHINEPLKESTIEVYTISPDEQREREERRLLGGGE
jgi:hypothetical protein